jgi:hypothetical protein
MTKNALSIAILTAAACQAADVAPLNAKPGLWEVTSVTERSGMPPIPADALAKMPPDQRARIEAQFKGSGPQTTTKQSCFTQDDVAKGLGLNKLDQSCRQTIVSSSGSKLEIKWECDGAQKNSGSMKIEAPDSAHVNSLIDITMGANGHVMNMKVTNTAKWLANSCGDVKPDTGKKE